MSDDLISRLIAIVGERHVLTDPEATAPYLAEPRGLFRGRALAVARPGSTPEVAEVVKLCAQTATPLVPQGGNTGLVGGNTPDGSGRAVVLSLGRMCAVREVDTDGDTMTVDAGLTLQAAQEAAARHGRLFPLSLASEGSCTIGGNIATNAGGTAVLAYGNMRDLVVGLEVVLADGRVWKGLRKLKKDNTGYDLRHIFIGSEGTLGIVTAAVLKLFPAPRAVETAFAGLASPEQALALFKRLRATAGPRLTACELIPRIGLDFVLRHGRDTRDPLAGPHPWYVLAELSSPQDGDLRGALEAALGEAAEAGEIDDAVLADSLERRAALWRLRHLLSEVQGREGGSIKHDVSVPVAVLPAFLQEAARAAQEAVPGSRPVPFGHLGDGNIHFNVSQPVGADRQDFLAHWDAMNEAVHRVVLGHGGSISAEHGIGRLKAGLLATVKDPVEMDLMRAVKSLLDPHGILNPGALIADRPAPTRSLS